MNPTLTFDNINAAALAQYPTLLQSWLPSGRIIGREFVCGDLSGAAGDSCKVNIDTGLWSDFATDESGNDPISLFAAIRGVKPGAALRELADTLKVSGNSCRTSPRSNPRVWTPIMPVHANAPPPNWKHNRHGTPNATWTYRDRNENIIGHVCRFDHDGGKKDIVPLTYCRGPEGREEWRWQAFPEPRPLYGLTKLALAKPDAGVLLVEGEKSADAAARLREAGKVCMTWPGGSCAVNKVDLSPLAGRPVGIWPDADAAGYKAALALAGRLKEVGAASVAIIVPPAEAVQGWDLADAEAEGWTVGKVTQWIQEHTMNQNEFAKHATERYEVAAPIVSAGAEADDSWTPAATKWPTLSLEALPGIAGTFVDLATRNSEADPAAVLATFLVRFGAELAEPYYMVGDTTHKPHLFAAIVGASSKARKGTSGAPVAKLFTFEESSGYTPASCSPGPLSTGEGLVYAVRDEVKSWVVDKKTHEGSWVVSDPGVTDKRLFVLDEELAAALQCTKREGNTLSTAMRCFWDNGNVAPLTKSERTRTTGAHLALVTHITTPELASLLGSVQAFNGFGNRFLWVCSQRRGLCAFPEPMDESELKALRHELLALLNVGKSTGRIIMDQTARELWKQVYPDLSQDHPGLVGCIVNRGEAQVTRLALLYALLDGEKLVNAKHLASALAFWRYCHESAMLIFGGREADPMTEKVLAVLQSGPKSLTEIHNALGNHDTKRAKDIMGEMSKSGRVRFTTVQTGGRSKTMFSLCEERELSELSPAVARTAGLNSHNSLNSQGAELEALPVQLPHMLNTFPDRVTI